MQEKTLQYVRNTLQDQITQNYGPEEEITIGYKDNHEELQAEMNTLEVGWNSIHQTAHESWTTKVVTGRVRVSSRSPTKGVRGDFGLGGGDLTESQDH